MKSQRMLFLTCFLHCSLDLQGTTFRALAIESSNLPVVTKEALAASQEFVTNARRNRIDKYGNVHFVLDEIQTVTRQGKLTEVITRTEFRSREDRYFRIDKSVLSSGDTRTPPESRDRFIVQPEGYLILFSENDKRPFVLGSWGTVDDGLVFLFNNIWMQRSTRSGRLPADMIVDELISTKSSLPNLYMKELPANSVNSQESLTMKLKWTSNTKEELERLTLVPDGQLLEVVWNSTSLEVPSWKSHSSMVCDPTRGVVVKYIREFAGTEGSMVETEVFEYGTDRFGCIPSSYSKRLFDKGKDRADYSTRTECRLLSVDWTPVPLGVFSFEAQGITSLQPEGVWQRRLTVVFWGLLLFGVVYLVHWYRNHVTE